MWAMVKRNAPMIIIGMLIAVSGFLLCCSTVDYKEHTGIEKCDMAIMMGKIKSRKGSEAFEIGRYVDGCFAELDRRDCKKDSFGNDPVNYDNKDNRYINYIQCLKDKK